MRRMMKLVTGLNRRTTLMSLLALGVGATTYGVIRGLRNGNRNRNRNKSRWQQMLQPLRGMLPTR
jgi:hypothetical protein